MSKANLRNELASAIHAENFDVTNDGIFFPRQGVMAIGEYFDRVNGGEWSFSKNLVPTEGLAHILNVAMGAAAKPTGYYLALSSGTAAPAANWTAASYTATANEIVSQTEGHTGSTRPAWTPTATTTNSIDNMAAAARVTIATASSLTVTGSALLTSSQRGGVTGVLVSAIKYPAERTFQNGDFWDLGYRLSLAV